VVSVYPLVSQVLLVTDPTFKVGVESQKGHVHGVLDCGSGKCKIEQIQNEEKVDKNEWFYTSGEDRIFPKGFPVGSVVSSDPGNGMRDVSLALSGAPGGVEEVLVVLQGVHQAIPSAPPEDETAKMLPAPPDDQADKPEVKPQTEADKVLHKYQDIGKDENHVYGGVGSSVPNFNTKPGAAAKPAAPATQSGDTDATDGEAKPVEVAPKTPVVAPAPAPPRAPAILGAPRTTETTGTTTTATHQPASKPAAKPSDSNLPLGAPRRKPATDTTATQTSPPHQ
jgi:rod shape-determining protein MreC